MNPDVIPTLPTYLFEPNLKGLLSFVLAVALPTLAALLMKRSWPASIKGVTLLAVAAVKTIVESLIAGGGSLDGLTQLVYTVGLNFAVAVVAYFGLLRGTSLQQKALDSGVKDDPELPMIGFMQMLRTIDGTYRSELDDQDTHPDDNTS